MRPTDPLKARKPLAGPAVARAAGPDAFASRLDEAERALERARALHEAYFLGLEKRAPETERLDLQRRLNDLRKQGTSNTALRFRLENLVQRHIVISTYWHRTLREIEAGTHRRDVFKAKRHLADRAAGTARGSQVDPGPAGDRPAPAATPAPAPLSATAAPPPARPAATPSNPSAAPANRTPAAPAAPAAAPPRAAPPPIPLAARKQATAAAIMSKPSPGSPGAAPPVPPPPFPHKR